MSVFPTLSPLAQKLAHIVSREEDLHKSVALRIRWTPQLNGREGEGTKPLVFHFFTTYYHLQYAYIVVKVVHIDKSQKALYLVSFCLICCGLTSTLNLYSMILKLDVLLMTLRSNS